MPSGEHLWALFDDLLTYEDMRLPHLGFELTGSGTHDRVEMRASYDLLRPEVAEVGSKLMRGAAVLLRWLDEYDDPLWRLCCDIETITGVTTRVSGMLLPQGSRPLPQPPRDADRVIVPIDGQLDVEIAGRAGTTSRHRLAPGSAVVTPCEAGVLLAAPQRLFILVIDVGRARASSLLELAAHDAQFFPLLRADVPTSWLEPVHSYAGSLYDSPGAFATAVADVFTARAFDRAAATARSDIPLRPTQRLSDTLRETTGPTDGVRSPIAGVVIAESAERWYAVAAGHRLLIDNESLEALAPFLDGRVSAERSLLESLGSVRHDAAAIVDGLVQLEIFERVRSL